MSNTTCAVATMVASVGDKLRPAAVLPMTRIVITGGERFSFMPISDVHRVPVSRILRMRRIVQVLG